MRLLDYLSANYKLPDTVLKKMQASGSEKTYAKNEVILEPHQASRSVFFVEKGMVKMYYYKEGRSITHFFLSENNFITRSENFLEPLQKDSSYIYGLMALEKQTRVFEIPFAHIQEWTATNIEINRLIQQILIDLVRSFSDRLNSLQFETAQERYQSLLSTHPEILQSAPLGDIASYLGISQQTLSLIRSQVR